MKSVGTRGRLLAGAALGLGLAIFVPAQAQAQCVVTPPGTPIAGTVTCDDTTTVNSTYTGTSPSNHRNYEVNTSASAFTGTVTGGEIVNGNGLAFTNTVSGLNALNVVNGGTIQVDIGNTPTAGGTAALNITAIGATPVNYSGNGDIINLGVGRGLAISSVDGNIVANSGGDISAATGEAVYATVSGTGSINFTNTGAMSSGNAAAVIAEISSITGGDLTLNLNDVTTIDGYYAIYTPSLSQTGDVNITTNGTVTGGGAFLADIALPTATGDINIVSNGTLVTNAIIMDVSNNGDGNVSVTTVGAATSGGQGMYVDTMGGNITINTGAVTVAAGAAIDANQYGSLSSGDIAITSTGAVSGGSEGIMALNTGLGGITITTGAGLVTGLSSSAIVAESFNALANDPVVVNVGTGGATGTGADAVVATTLGTGTVTVNSAGPVISDTGDGIFTSATTGATAVNVTGGSVNGGVDGINANATTGPIAVTLSGGADITGTDDAISLDTSGAKTVTIGAGSVVSGAYGVYATGGATVTVTNAGTLGVAGTDAVLTDLATRAIITNQTGGVINGSFDLSDQNDIVTNAGTLNLDGVQGFYLGNDSIINQSGGTVNVSGTVDFGAGSDTFANNAGGTVNIDVGTTFDELETLTNAGTLTGGGFGFTGVATTVTNSGTFNATGPIEWLAGGATFANTASGTLNISSGVNLEGLAALNNAGTVNAATGLTLDSGNTVVTNTGNFNAAGTIDFGAGTDAFFNNSAGVFTLGGATTLAGLESFNNAGRINLGTYVLTGPAIAFTNAGTIDTNGNAGLAGFTAFNNAGILDLAAGTFTAPAGVLFTNSGTVIADEGATTITAQSSFANTGTIDLQDGAIDDVLTINSNFAGSGNSALLVDFSATDSDLLIINGAASGTTTIGGNFLGGGLIVDGVLVVDATTATADAFVLGNVDSASPLVDFSLVQDGGDFFFYSTPTAAAFNPLVVPGFATDLWYQSANEVFAETGKPATTVGVSVWGNGYYSRDKWDDDDDDIVVDGVEFDVDYGRKTRRHGIQGGVDYGFPGARVGLTGGYGWAKSNGANNADLKAKGWNIGLYGQFGAITGFHGEVLVKHDRYDAGFKDGAFDGVDFDIRSTGFDGSLGYRMGMGADGNVDIFGGLSHVRTKVDDIEAFGFTYDTGRLTSTRGRAGVRATFGGALAPYVAGTIYHEFKGDGDIDLFDGDETFGLDTRGKGTWGRLEAGLSGNDGPGPILAAWGELGDRKGLGLRAGWRIGGGRVIDAAPPPPPPPPAPEAPATQTCADGTVILATDSCPLPPPPPPPPLPEPERG